MRASRYELTPAPNNFPRKSYYYRSFYKCRRAFTSHFWVVGVEHAHAKSAAFKFVGRALARQYCVKTQRVSGFERSELRATGFKINLAPNHFPKA